MTWKLKALLNIAIHSLAHGDVIFNPNFRCKLTGLIATACGDDKIRIFREDPTGGDPDQPSFHLVAVMENGHTQDVNSVAWNPKEAGLLASCSDDGLIKLWHCNASV